MSETKVGSFREFYNEGKEVDESKSMAEQIKAAGFLIIHSRIIAIFNNVPRDLIECKTFTYKKDSEGKIGTVKLTFKCGAKSCNIELCEEHNITYKHNIKGSVKTDDRDPDVIMQLNILSGLFNRKSYAQGIKQSMIALAEKLEADKERGKKND